MNDETMVLTNRKPSFAYLFWGSGPRRGDVVMLKESGSTLGRNELADVVLDDAGVSAQHARVRLEEATWCLYDLATKNATRVAGEVVHRRELQDGDVLTVGSTTLVFRLVK